MKNFKYLILSGLVILLDQISKYLVRSKLELHKPYELVGKYLRLYHCENDGAAFSLSLGSYSQYIFIALTIVVIGILVMLMKKSNYKIQLTYYSLIIGGAIGNLVDRILFGKVTDFIDSLYPRIPSEWGLFYAFDRWPTFNIADSAIVVGMVLFAYDAIILENKRKKSLEEA